MTTAIDLEVDDPDLLVAVVDASGVTVAPSPPALAAEIDRTLAARGARDAPPESVKGAIRDLLRRGGYKPTGRGKPAGEYLAQAAARGEFPRISGVVDALNLVSLESGLPISLLDADRALEGATGLVVRRGREGERFVFNASGQEIDVAGLLGVARRDGGALGNPVKDGMATKTTETTRNVVALIWASRRAVDEPGLRAVAERLARLLAEHAGAASTSVRLLGEESGGR